MGPDSTESAPSNATSFQNNYSGGATFLYSSKIANNVSLEGMCETLAASNSFCFAMTNRGKLYYKETGRLKSALLNIAMTITEQGMKVSGHRKFLDDNPGDSNIYALSTALNLHLSDTRLFNTAFGFPCESARVFMRPLAIKYENMETYELIVPCVRLYKDGIISISLPTVLGFEDSTIQDVVQHEVNKSRLNIESLLCEKELYLACTETQLSQMSRRERLSQRKSFESMMAATLSHPEEMQFINERLTVYELVQTDQLTLTDVARNLLSLVSRTIALGNIKTGINWYAEKYVDESVGLYWHGKPLINIRRHSSQMPSATENWATHRQLVDSVLARTVIPNNSKHSATNLKDLRYFDDFNNFYSEPVSLLIASAQVESAIEAQSSYSFENLTSDIQVLNESAHYILIYYAYATIEVDGCKTAIEVARLEMNILNFEQSLLSAHKYGEIANFIEEVQQGDHLKSTFKLLHKKIETISKALELDEKIAAESYNRRITMIFGIIASATLSPELMQPLANYFNISSANEDVNKLYGISVSVAAVIATVVVTHYIFKFGRWIRSSVTGR